ncbi:MAG: HAMP domain-containing histidine kinase, partial [Candidatus Roizmanbacteria bacterium]|nr:HAMP domain-containing histidine kinase [Candidatus Roizmanbacteria bacterium]
IKELRGKKITDLPLEDEAGDLIPLDKRPTSIALLSGEINKATYYVVKRDKTRSPLAITSTPIKLKGKIIGLVEIIRDITRESQINKAKSEFVSLASHQLRTPLGIAKWYIGAIQDEQYIDKAPEIAKDYLNEIYKCNERLLVLVRELLSISRIDQGKVRDMPKITDMIQLVKDVVKAMHIIAEKNKVTINLVIKQQKLPTMVIDPLRMQEMLENMLTNAIEYSNALGKVEVTVDKQDDTLVIIIKDTGIGISAEDKKSLYTKFYRSEKAIGHNPEGSGLGLYVVKSYVEGWGGKISVESAEDKGSTFTISLPFSQK